LREVLKAFGLDERVRLRWISASEGPQFAEEVTKMVEDMKKLGPNPLKEETV